MMRGKRTPQVRSNPSRRYPCVGKASRQAYVTLPRRPMSPFYFSSELQQSESALKVCSDAAVSAWEFSSCPYAGLRR